MNKIIFNDSTEFEISNVTEASGVLTVTINTSDINPVIEKFRDSVATSVMRYYSGIDLIRGYSGYTTLQNITFTPDVVSNIDYEKEDKFTESGFAETVVDMCVVTMKKESLLTSIAGQTAQNTANIDYLAMETGVEL